MASLLGGEDGSCSTHNALRNLTTGNYACGIELLYGSSSSSLQDVQWYGVPALQQCCDRANAPVMRIPGNTGCEMQYCEVPEVTNESSTGTLVTGPDEDLYSCIRLVSDSDVPEYIGRQLRYVSSWYSVAMYDDELPLDQVRDAVVADVAPDGWLSSSSDPSSRPNAQATGVVTDVPGSSTQATGVVTDVPGSSTRATGAVTDVPGSSTRATGVVSNVPGSNAAATLGHGLQRKWSTGKTQSIGGIWLVSLLLSGFLSAGV